MLRRKLQRNYADYVAFANPDFCMTHFHKYLCDKIQEFIEAPSRNAIDILLLSVPPRHGKAMRKDMPVWTPNGWRKHGDLRVGDRVYDAYGHIQKVIQVHPDTICHGWNIVTSTGERIEGMSPQHLWNITYVDRSSHKTKEITKTVETQHILQQNRYLLERAPRIHCNAPCEGERRKFVIEPYVLGLWLGDGYSHKGTICGNLDDLLEELPYDDIYHTRDNFGEAREVISTTILKEHNLYKNKHIPVEYLTADEHSRRLLLAGLLDTDGNISRLNCQCEITLANERLARDVYTLVRTLGYKAQFKERITHCQNKNFVSKAWRVMFRPHDGDVLFGLDRKQSIVDDWSKLYKESAVSNNYYIADVYDTNEDIVCNCISVTGDGTYLVGEDLIPTHNSYTVTETLPSWYLGKYPSNEVILCSYEGGIAEAFNRRNRDKFNTYATDVFHCKANPNIQGVELWETEQHGRCRAAGLKAGITGWGANLFIIDDPIKNREAAMSETIVSKIHDEMGPSVQSRIYPGGKLIAIQTRWIENDVIGYIETNWKEYIWDSINLPCECEHPETDPLSRHLGDSLMGPHLGDYNLPPKIRNDNDWLKSKKMLVLAGEGESTWNALYQGHPSAQNGNLFKTEWWQYYHRRDLDLGKVQYLHMSVDATFKQSETSDMVAIVVQALWDNKIWLYKLVNKRMGFTATVAKIKSIVADFTNLDELIIEDKANGSAIIDTLQQLDGMPVITPVNPKGGKYSRAQAIAPWVERKIYNIPYDDDWTELECLDVDDDDDKLNHRPTRCFVEQHKRFPFARHDDIVDANSQGTARLIKLLTGEEPVPQRRFIRFVRWYPDMWDDYNKMDPLAQENFILTYGAPLEWQDEGE